MQPFARGHDLQQAIRTIEEGNASRTKITEPQCDREAGTMWISRTVKHLGTSQVCADTIVSCRACTACL